MPRPKGSKNKAKSKANDLETINALMAGGKTFDEIMELLKKHEQDKGNTNPLTC